ncbi:MAG: amidase [Pirellulales bacterium]|nr:amidase [Pirellulales bacterium]
MATSVPATADIIGQGAARLAQRMASGELSVREVIEAHLARIAEVDRQLNAVICPCFDEARRAAAAADAARKHGEPLGPLFGVPVTIKECLDVAGTASTLGLPRLARRLAKFDGPLVARLRAAGAIVVGKTNVSQLAMYMESDGPLFGRTNNPWNLDRSPGGSSGGEAAILAAGGSALGLATDAGGSIRHPAHCCGVHGLKPTSGRLTQVDLPVTTVTRGERWMPTNLAGLHSILQVGPMAREVADLELAMQVLAAPGLETTDPTVPPIPWSSSAAIDVRQLRVGVYEDEGLFPIAPSIRRVVRSAADALRAAGADVRPFTLPDPQAATDLLVNLIFCDGGAAFVRMLGDTKLDPRLSGLMRAVRMPAWQRPMASVALRLFGQERLASSLKNLRNLSADGLRRRISERAEYTTRFLAAMDALELDVLIGPPHPVPAPLHGSSSYLGLTAAYTGLFNLLGMPAGVVAAGRVQPGEASPRAPGRCLVERTVAAVEANSAGLPVGVHVAGRHWREDIVLAVMAALERHFRAQPDYPARPPI